MTASDLRDQFVTALVRANAGNRHHWRTVVGPVRVYSIATHSHCNWSVTPSGTVDEVAEVERIADHLRETCPIVIAG